MQDQCSDENEISQIFALLKFGQQLSENQEEVLFRFVRKVIRYRVKNYPDLMKEHELKYILSGVLEVLWSSIKKFDDSRTAENWLRGIVKNKCKEAVRRVIKQRERLVYDSEETLVQIEDGQSVDWEDHVDSELDAPLLKQALLEGIQCLPDKEYDVFYHRIHLGLSPKATAEKLGIPQPRVNTYLGRARDRLKEHLEGNAQTA